VAQARGSSGDKPDDGAFDGQAPTAVFHPPVRFPGLLACSFKVIVVRRMRTCQLPFAVQRILSGSLAHRG
jgi:hypothetical protein